MTNNVEADTIGNWVGHTAKSGEPDAIQKAVIGRGLELLTDAAGSNSRNKGFHQDWPSYNGEGEPYERSYDAGEMRRAIVEKLALIHEEISEALGEIRSGHSAKDVYYSNVVKLQPYPGSVATEEHRTWFNQDWEPIDDALPHEGSRPVLKPEGFGVELADAVIRIADLAYLTGVDLGALVLEKMTYNATRPHKHGRQF